jgi:hypothetical protein
MGFIKGVLECKCDFCHSYVTMKGLSMPNSGVDSLLELADYQTFFYEWTDVGRFFKDNTIYACGSCIKKVDSYYEDYLELSSEEMYDWLDQNIKPKES